MNVGGAECFKIGHINSDVRFFTISVKRGKGGRTLTATVRIVMSTYPVYIPLFSLQPGTIALLLSDDKGYGIWEKNSWGDRCGTADLLQGRKGWEDQPPPLYDPVLGRIEATVNDDQDNLIVDGIEETCDLILSHQIRGLICL